MESGWKTIQKKRYPHGHPPSEIINIKNKSFFIDCPLIYIGPIIGEREISARLVSCDSRNIGRSGMIPDNDVYIGIERILRQFERYVICCAFRGFSILLVIDEIIE